MSAALDLSSPAVAVAAVGLNLTSTEVTGPVDDAGNANPDSGFRYSPGLGAGGGYVYNLSTKGRRTGSWALLFYAAGDPVLHRLLFQLK